MRAEIRTAVHDDTTDSRSVAANPLCGAVDDDVRTVFNGADEISCIQASIIQHVLDSDGLTSHAEGLSTMRGMLCS